MDSLTVLTVDGTDPGRSTDIGTGMKTPILISVNGWMGSGKSTVADTLIRTLTEHVLTCDLIEFRKALEARAQAILDEAAAAVWGKTTVDDLILALTERHGPWSSNVAVLEAAQLAVKIVDETIGRPDPSVRTPDMRTFLQNIGSTWAVPGYWPGKVVAQCLARLEQVDAVITTCRYPVEAQMTVDNGGLVIRLDVSARTQRKRLARRDGFITTAAALNHPGEHALDRWPGFRRRFDTETTSADEIAAAVLGEALSLAWPRAVPVKASVTS